MQCNVKVMRKAKDHKLDIHSIIIIIININFTIIDINKLSKSWLSWYIPFILLLFLFQFVILFDFKWKFLNRFVWLDFKILIDL